MSALFDLDEVLRAKQVKLTPSEVNFLAAWKSKARKDFYTGSLVGGTIMWAATWRLRKIYQTELSIGAAIGLGFWRCSKSLDSCVDYVLSLEGSRLQHELANIMAKKYGDDPSKMKILSKHFYSEKVYDDSVSGPKLRWRFRNFFSDHGTLDHKTNDDDSYGHSQGNNDSQTPSHSHSDSQPDSFNKTHLGSKQSLVSASSNSMSESDPLDSLFGDALSPMEEIPVTNTPSTPTRASSRSHRRSHRRRRMRHHEDSLDSQTE